MESIVQNEENILVEKNIDSIQVQANSEQYAILLKNELLSENLSNKEVQSQTEKEDNIVEISTSATIETDIDNTTNKEIAASLDERIQNSEISTQNNKQIDNELEQKANASKMKKIMTQVKAIMGIHYMKNDGIPAEILPGFYLGSIGAAFNKKNLETEKIGHILCCCDGVKEVYPTLFKYKFLPLLDKPTEDITKYFEETSEYIHDILSRGEKVLVHCFAGKSRSTTIMISYLIKHHKMSVDQALDIIRSKRPVIRPNIGFVSQLRAYEKKILTNQIEKEIEQN